MLSIKTHMLHNLVKRKNDTTSSGVNKTGVLHFELLLLVCQADLKMGSNI